MTLVSVIRPKPQCYFSDEINQNSCNNNNNINTMLLLLLLQGQ